MSKEERLQKYLSEHPDFKFRTERKSRCIKLTKKIVHNPVRVRTKTAGLKVNNVRRVFCSGHQPTERLFEMFRLREEGWSYPRLAARYGCDHTTVLHHCKKHGIEPRSKKKGKEVPQTIMDIKHAPQPIFGSRKSYYIRRIPVKSQKRFEIEVYPGKTEIVNRGKLKYAEYLEEDRKREEKLLLSKV